MVPSALQNMPREWNGLSDLSFCGRVRQVALRGPLWLRRTTEVNRPVKEVFDYVDDATNLPEWNSIVEESTPSQTPIGVGTKITQRARFLGRKFESVAIVTEHVPNQRSLLKIDKPFALTITNRFEAAGRGTKSTLVAEGRAWRLL